MSFGFRSDSANATERPTSRPNHRVVLRKIIEADLPTFYEHQCDEEACRVADFTSRDRGAFMAHWARILRDPTVISRAVVCDGELTGNVCSFDSSGRREIGYWIGRSFWGRGIASAAVRQFLDIETYRPLHAHVAVHNTASVRVLDKCGFDITRKEDRTQDPPKVWCEALLAR